MTKVTKIYGPPGTGKTEKLIRRAMAYIRVGTPVNKIGYFAFTRKAAHEARDRMLKKNPLERISPTEALNHNYFSETMEEEEEVDIVPELMKPKKQNLSCESPLLTSANQDRLMKKTIKKDSCVDFKMGRENGFTGKVDTLVETGSTNNSVGKRFESIISPKASKFSAKK